MAGFGQERPVTKLNLGDGMSFDIILLKPTASSIGDLSEVDDVVPLGSAKSVSAAFNAAFPNCFNGVFISGEDYAVEGSMSGDPVQSVHLALRFGHQASGDGTEAFLAALGEICRQLGAVAFAVSDNSRISPS